LSIRRSVAWVGADGALGASLAPTLGAQPFPLRCPDLSDDDPIPELAGFDVVIDGAGPRVHPGLAWGDYLREHVGTATRVARSMRPGGHLVFISSAAIYGAGRGEVSASTAPRPDTFPVPPYAWAKLAAEHAARAVSSERGVALTVLRPSIIYGPGAGGVLVTLRDLARRGVRASLSPGGTRQHLLHLDLFRRVLEGLIAAPPPSATSVFVVADPFVLTSAELNAAYLAAGPKAAPLPVPIGLVARATRGWQRRTGRELPGRVAVAAMLGLDNAYDWQPCLAHLAIDPAAFGRSIFDAFLEA
jgi:nucleoside-diphosphate-sugar epimerase